ncbi:hypothetical protein [Burkholderia cenocepacia]|uniref:hypothetical protein n=1 Tax=Burkholderia cenocepacia TaxID=95486 RepID=UPI002ABDCC6D|nr:hypothetical protein [Burkholderia cenocepacia]
MNALPLNALDQRARARAIDWMREAEARDYSPADVIDDCLTCLQFLGIDVDTDRKGRPCVDYSLGSGRGDFVTFSGGWRVADMDIAALLDYAPQDEALRSVAGQFTAILLQYPHSTAGIGSMRDMFVIDADYGEDASDDATLTVQLLGAVKATAAWMLARMQADYEDRMSDESCIDMIEASDYRFTEAGDFVPEVTAC